MNNTYNHIAHQLLNNPSKSKFHFFMDEMVDNEKYQDEKFLRIYTALKDIYQVVYKLVGDENFKFLSHKYMQLNPTHTLDKTGYGKSFPMFLADTHELMNIPFLKPLAMLDWFWMNETDYSKTLILPEGTLEAWGSIGQDLEDLDFEINFNETEEIKIEKKGQDVSIITL